MIKVCGMRESQNIREIESLGIDWMGFIFWPQSKRYCSVKPDYLPTLCKRVGVFVNAEIDEVVQKTIEYGLDFVQLHGDEDRAYILELRKALAQSNVVPMMIKALSLQSKADLARCNQYVGFVDYFLFDTPSAGYGGTGKTFDWSLLNEYSYFTPFLLSGGVGPKSVDAIMEFNNPFCAGFDLNSQFESAPGVKDVKLLREFIVQTMKS